MHETYIQTLAIDMFKVTKPLTVQQVDKISETLKPHSDQRNKVIFISEHITQHINSLTYNLQALSFFGPKHS